PDARISSGQLKALIGHPKAVGELSRAVPRIGRPSPHRHPKADVTGAVSEVDGLQRELEFVDVARQTSDGGVAHDETCQRRLVSAPGALGESAALGVDLDRLIFEELRAVVAQAAQAPTQGQ